MRHTLALMLVVLCLGSCGIAAPSTTTEATPTRSTLIPPITFQEADLIGRWEKIFTKYSTEVLILNPDYTFLQMYETAQGDYEGRGTWRSKGVTFAAISAPHGHVCRSKRRKSPGTHSRAVYGIRMRPKKK